MEHGNEIDDLIKLISKLPGSGPKSAKRIVLKLINNRDELVKPLAKSLAEVYKNISRCKICGALKSISIECDYENCKIVDKKYEISPERYLNFQSTIGLQYPLLHKFYYILLLYSHNSDSHLNLTLIHHMNCI